MKPPQWVGVAIAFYAFIAIGIAESGLGVVLPSILITYDLTPASVGWLFVSQISGFVLAALSSSLIRSRLGLAPLLCLAASALTLALLIYALAALWPVMVAAGLLLGLGIGLIDAGINTYIMEDTDSGHLIGSLHGFYGVGALAGPALATTLLALGLDWRQVYLALAGIVSLLLVAVVGILLLRYAPMTQRPEKSSHGALRHLGRSLHHPAVLLSGLLLLIYVGTEAAIGNWAYAVQTIARQTPALTAGYSVSAYWLGLTVGRFGLSYGLRHLGANRVITYALSLLLLSLLAWWLLPAQWLSLPLIGFALAPIFPATIWLIPTRVPKALVPAAISFATSAASLGAALVPSTSGWVASWAGLGVIPPLMLPLAIALCLIHRRLQTTHP